MALTLANQKKKILLLALPVIALGAFLPFINKPPQWLKAGLADAPQLLSLHKQPPPVTLTEIKKGKLTDTLLLEGELRAVHSRTIFSSSASFAEQAKITY